MSNLKVYGWISAAPALGYTQARLIVAATSFAAVQRAAEAAGLFKPRRNYSSVTGNPRELEVALADPRTVYGRALDDWNGDYIAIPANTTLVLTPDERDALEAAIAYYQLADYAGSGRHVRHIDNIESKLRR